MDSRAELVPRTSPAPGRAAEPSGLGRSIDAIYLQPMAGLIEDAKAAVLRGDWHVAAQCWDAVRRHAPDYAPAYLGAATALRKAERHEEAELVLNAGQAQFPGHEQMAIEAAWQANARSD